MVWIFSPYSLLLEVASGLRYTCELMNLAREALILLGDQEHHSMP